MWDRGKTIFRNPEFDSLQWCHAVVITPLMPAPTDAEILDAIRQAIFDIVSKKVESVTIGQQQFRYQDLNKLREMKREYENAAAAETYGNTALINFRGAGRS